MKKTKKELGLNLVWHIRMKLRAKGKKLRAKGYKLWAKGYKLWAEGSQLWAEGDSRWAEGDQIWIEAILKVYGNIKIEWKNWDEKKQSYECHLETGEIFKP